MPITPLHFGLIPLINRVSKTKMSTPGFILANLIIDFPVVTYFYMQNVQEMGGPEVTGTPHDVFGHTFLSALVIGVVLSLFKFKNKAWWLGCVLGAVTHVGLDMFVHSDVQPFAPLTSWNPFYFEPAHAIFSVGLTVGLALLVLDYLDQRKDAREALNASQHDQPV